MYENGKKKCFNFHKYNPKLYLNEEYQLIDYHSKCNLVLSGNFLQNRKLPFAIQRSINFSLLIT